MNRRHDDVLWNYCCELRRRGFRIACEVGIPGGRIDAVRVDSRGVWAELYEKGIEQLLRYADVVEGNPALTLVVTPSLHSRDLSSQSAAAGVGYEVFAGSQDALFGEPFGDGTIVILPYLHPGSLERADVKRREWLTASRAA